MFGEEQGHSWGFVCRMQVQAGGGKEGNCSSGRGRPSLRWPGSWRQKAPPFPSHCKEGAALSPAVLAFILCTLVVRALPGQAEGVGGTCNNPKVETSLTRGGEKGIRWDMDIPLAPSHPNPRIQTRPVSTELNHQIWRGLINRAWNPWFSKPVINSWNGPK